MRKKKRWALIMAIVMLILSVPNSMIQAQEIQSTQEFAIECAVESESNPLYGFNSETARKLHLKVHSKQRFQKHQVPD